VEPSLARSLEERAIGNSKTLLRTFVCLANEELVEFRGHSMSDNSLLAADADALSLIGIDNYWVAAVQKVWDIVRLHG